MMGINGSILESAISEQLFCTQALNPNNKPCYGISTVSGLQRAAAQGQKIYRIDQGNQAQLKHIAMSGNEMIQDITTAINSGGYVIVPERSVDGTGKSAIYVYMTYNAQTASQAWKISGGLNGGWFSTLLSGGLTVLLILGMLNGASEALLLIGTIVSLTDSLISFLDELDTCLGDAPGWLGTGLLVGITVMASVAGTIAASVYAAFGGFLETKAISSPVNAICKTF